MPTASVEVVFATLSVPGLFLVLELVASKAYGSYFVSRSCSRVDLNFDPVECFDKWPHFGLKYLFGAKFGQLFKQFASQGVARKRLNSLLKMLFSVKVSFSF